MIGAIVVFSAVSCIQLYACYTYNVKLKAISKGFIMLSLFWLYAASVPVMQPAVVAAIVMSFAGDMLLIKNSWLTYGGLAFFTAHAAYIFTFIQSINFGLSAPVFIIPPLAYICVVAAIVMLVKHHAEKKHYAGAGVYIAAVCTMSFFALLQLCSLKNTAAAFIFAGSLLFIASDVLLLLREFRKDIMKLKHKYTLVMSTYIFAQFFIILGIVQLSY